MAFDPVTGRFIPDLPLQTGLAGTEAALIPTNRAAIQAIGGGTSAGLAGLQRATAGGVSALQQGQEAASGLLSEGIAGFSPIASQGTQAAELQAALAGALGPDQQRAALAQLAPTNEFLESQGRRQVLQSAAATGGLGGGNVLRDLTRFGQGLASTNLQQNIGNLGQVANRGQSALQNIAALRQAQAQGARGLGQGVASTLQRVGELGLSANQQAGSGIASLLSGLGSQLGQARTRAGERHSCCDRVDRRQPS